MVQRLATGWTVRGSNPGRDEIFRTCPDRPWGRASLLYNGYRVFPGGKERPGRDADPSPLLVQWSRKSRATPLLPIWAVRPVQSLSACTKEHFTFTFTCLLTPCSRVLLEKPRVSQLVKNFPTFYGTGRFITTDTSVLQLSLS